MANNKPETVKVNLGTVEISRAEYERHRAHSTRKEIVASMRGWAVEMLYGLEYHEPATTQKKK